MREKWTICLSVMTEKAWHGEDEKVRSRANIAGENAPFFVKLIFKCV